MSKKQNFTKGRRGEDEAKNFLVEKGFELIESNYNCDMGEIDLIMKDHDWLVFVEVKYKSDDSLGIPEEMIDKRKISQVRRVAQYYLLTKVEVRKKFLKYRIDAICILGNEINYYDNLE